MKISDYAKAQGWLKRHAASENSVGEWKKYVALNTTPELDIALQTIDDKFGPGTVFPASEAPIPPKTDQQAVFEFGQRNPKADGGRIGFRYAGPVTFENIIKPKIYEQGNRWKKVPKGTFTMRLYMGLDENGNRIEETFTGTKTKLKKIFDKQNKGRVKGDKPTLKAGEVLQIRQGKNKNKWAIKMPKEDKYSFYKSETLAEKHKTDYLNDPANKVGQGSRNIKRKVPTGYVTGEKMLEAAKKKNIFVGKSRDPNNFANVFDFPKTMVKNKNFYDISKLNNENAVDKILEAQVKSGSGTDYAKKKFPVKSTYAHTKKRVDKIVAEGGWGKNDPWSGKKGSGVQLGHADDFWVGRRITPQSLLYTPSEINKLLGDPGMIDDKINAVYEKQEYGKLTKKGDDLKIFLNETDATLTRLADQSGGFKQVTLSNNKPYGGGKFSVDLFDDFKGMSQKEAIQFVNKWKDEKTWNTAEEFNNIKKAKIFEINRKNAYKAALKMSQKDKTKIMGKIKGEDFNKQISDYITGKSNQRPKISSQAGFISTDLLGTPQIKALMQSDAYKIMSKAAKVPGKFFGVGDILLGAIDYHNNITKKQSPKLAAKNALQAMSFHLWKGGDNERLKEVRELAIKNGMDGDVFDSITYMNEKQNLFQKTIDHAKFKWDDFKKHGMDSAANALKVDSGKRLTEIMADMTTGQKSLKTNVQVDEAGAPININVDDKMLDAYKDVRSTGIDYRTKQAKDAYEMQKTQVHPGAGYEGEALLNSVMTKDSYKKLLPQNWLSTFNQLLPFMPYKPVTEKEKQAKRLREMEGRELYLYNKARGKTPDQPLSGESTLEFILQNPKLYGSPTSYFDGGIASLRRKK
jgi:hypothetical protein